MTDIATQPYRLYLLDDHALFREGLARLLESQSDFAVAGKSETVAQALKEVPEIKPDLILLDVDLGTERAAQFLREIRAVDYAGKILIVTAGVSEFEAMQLVHEGACGIFHKHNPPQALCEAIRQVSRGEVVLEQRYLRGLFSAVDPRAVDPRPHLSEREVQVLRYLLQGFVNKEIGSEMGLSESSIKAVLSGLFDKLGVRTRSQLVKVALDQYRDQI